VIRPVPKGEVIAPNILKRIEQRARDRDYSLTMFWRGVAAASLVRSAVMVENGRAEEFGARSVTADFFPLLGVRPVRGILFTHEEDKPGNTSCPGLISYRLWQTWFAGDENIIGRKVVINSQPGTIVGVLPPDFYFSIARPDLCRRGPSARLPQDARAVDAGCWPSGRA
jgi:hypothetical protein